MLPGISCYDAQLKCGLTAKTLKIGMLAEKSIPRTISNTPMGNYCSLKKKCNLQRWKKPDFVLGNTAAAEQGKKKLSSKIRYLLQAGEVTLTRSRQCLA